MKIASTLVGLRLDVTILERVDALAARLRQNPDNVAMRLNRSSLLRLALLRGLESLEGASARATPADNVRSPP